MPVPPSLNKRIKKVIIYMHSKTTFSSDQKKTTVVHKDGLGCRHSIKTKNHSCLYMVYISSNTVSMVTHLNGIYGSVYPIDVVCDPVDRQTRWVHDTIGNDGGAVTTVQPGLFNLGLLSVVRPVQIPARVKRSVY